MSSASQELSSSFIIGLVVYVTVLAVIGYLFSHRKNEGENFLTGGKAISLLPLLGTIGATMIGTGLSLGATANGFRYGWGGSLFALGCALGTLALLIFIPVRKYGFITMPEEAQFYYGGNKLMRHVTAIMMFIAEVVWVGSHINGGSLYLSYVTGLDAVTAKTITLVAFMAFTIFGGYLSVVWTDTIQFFIIILGFLTIAFTALPLAGGYEAIEAAYAAAGNSGALSFYGLEAYGLMAALALLGAAFFGNFATPVHRFRIYTATDERTARKGFLSAAFILLIFSIMPSIIGMSAFTLASANGIVLENADFAFSYMAVTVLGPVMGLLFLIAGISATLSSADSDAISGVTIMLNDLYPAMKKKAVPEKVYKKYSRIALLLTVGLSFLMALYATDVIGYVTNVVGSLLPGIGVCMLLGRLWKRATWQGGLTAVFTGTVFGILYLVAAPFHDFIFTLFAGPAIPATLLSLVLGGAVSLCTPANTISEEIRLQMVMEARHG